VNDTRIWVTLTVRLDCGCEIVHTLTSTSGPDALARVLQVTCDSLPHHFDRTVSVHQCELVSESNPNGRSQTKEH
jgi:hypothetical protein